MRPFILLIALLIPFPAFAGPITWTLENVTFDDGTNALGSFNYDADLDVFSAINVTTSFLGTNYSILHPFVTSDASFPNFLTTGTGDLSGNPYLGFLLSESMTNSGGVISIDTGLLVGFNFSFEGICLASDCSTVTPERNIVAGSIRGESMDTPVPVPATLALVGLGLLGLSASRRRKLA